MILVGEMKGSNPMGNCMQKTNQAERDWIRLELFWPSSRTMTIRASSRFPIATVRVSWTILQHESLKLSIVPKPTHPRILEFASIIVASLTVFPGATHFELVVKQVIERRVSSKVAEAC